MKYGLLTYQDTYRGTNIGDYIQSLAAEQFLPRIDKYLNREHLNTEPDEPIKLIMNGWFSHHPENWPPSQYIDPLFIAFHINSVHADKLLSSETLRYLKVYEPIGCRDQFTMNLLKSKNIESYFSGCLTLTLDKYKVSDSERNEKIYIVDPLFNLYSFSDAFTSISFFLSYLFKGRFIQSIKRQKIIKKIISRSIIERAYYEHHMIRPNHFSDEERFEIARKLLDEYAHAKCVITSRIHCALPCLALGTPVIFINGFHDESNKSRIEGLNDLLNIVDIDIRTGRIIKSDVPLENGIITINSIIPNKNDYLKYSKNLKETVEYFIK